MFKLFCFVFFCFIFGWVVKKRLMNNMITVKTKNTSIGINRQKHFYLKSFPVEILLLFFVCFYFYFYFYQWYYCANKTANDITDRCTQLQSSISVATVNAAQTVALLSSHPFVSPIQSARSFGLPAAHWSAGRKMRRATANRFGTFQTFLLYCDWYSNIRLVCRRGCVSLRLPTISGGRRLVPVGGFFGCVFEVMSGPWRLCVGEVTLEM